MESKQTAVLVGHEPAYSYSDSLCRRAKRVLKEMGIPAVVLKRGLDQSCRDYIRVSIDEIDRCSIVLLLPGWNGNKSAELLASYAEFIGKPCVNCYKFLFEHRQREDGAAQKEEMV